MILLYNAKHRAEPRLKGSATYFHTKPRLKKKKLPRYMRKEHGEEPQLRERNCIRI